MNKPSAFAAGRIFDGDRFHDRSALLVDDGRIVGLAPENDVPSHFELAGERPDLIVPGFVDLQVNGGGGALFNDMPTKAAIETICSAHAQFGTTALLPTLITDLPEVRDCALRAGAEARQAGVPGYLGLHLEGPHLSIERKGAHVADFIRPMNDDDLAALLAAQKQIGVSIMTIAPENVTREQVGKLVAGGWHVSLGHTDCSAADAFSYFEVGASLATHLFNAMSQLRNREAGLVGAVLASNNVSCGLIADGIHVEQTSMHVALNAKRGPGHIFFVTDAMSPTGTDATEFMLGGRRTFRRDGRLTLADGTLAGADIDMISMVRKGLDSLGLPFEEILRMASLYPAMAVGVKNKGHLKAGSDADFIFLDDKLNLDSTWIAGHCCFASGQGGAEA